MEATIDYHPAHIEFLGTPGSGKTTLLAALASFLKERRYQPYTVVEAARPFALRTWQGKVINRLAPSSLRKPLLWQVFSFHSLWSRQKFVKAHAELIRQVSQHQRQRPDQADERDRGVLYWFYRLTGYYEFLRSRIADMEILLFDDGFVHRVVHLFASEVETPDPRLIRDYLELIPKPDLIIVPNTPLDICEKRVHHRGIWKHSQHKTPEQIRSYLAHAEQVVRITTEYLRDRGWPIIFLDNGERSPEVVNADLCKQLESLDFFHSKPAPLEKITASGTPAGQFLHLPRPSRLFGIVRSRQRPLDIDINIVNDVIKSFDLNITGRPENLPLSKRTQNVLIPTQAGKKVLKRYRPMLPFTTIEYSHSIVEELAKINYPAIRLIENIHGATNVEIAGFHYSLSTFVEGSSYSSSFLLRNQRKQILTSAGKNLAQFHRALRHFTPSGRHHLGFNAKTGDWERGVNWFIEKCRQLKSKSLLPQYDQDRRLLDWLGQNYENILAEMAKMDALLQEASLPRLVIHGDYGLHNLVFPKDGLITMLDFETARLEWRLSDLVSACSRLRFRNGNYDLETIRSFISAYQSEFPIEFDEWRWLPEVWRFYKLRSALIYWNSYLDTGGPSRKLISAQDAVRQADWAIQNREILLNLIPGIKEAS